MLTTGALRSRLSLKYRRVQFGWFGCPAVHLYHHRSVTYGLSSLSSLRCSPPSCSTTCALPIVYPTPSFPSAASPPFGHQPNSTPCPFFLSYSFASPASTANEPRACQIQSHLLIPRDLISTRSCSFFPSYSPISLFSLSRGCRATVDFFQPSNDCGKCRCFGPADASITARHCTLRSSIFEISM